MVVFTCIGEGEQNRLTPVEVAAMAQACYEMHDHTVKRPQQPIWWERVRRYEFAGAN